MKPSSPKWLWPVLAGTIMIAGVSLAARYSFAGAAAGRSVQDLGQAPSFQLTNQENRQVASSDLSGKTLLISFIYTSCPDICGLTTQRVAAVQALVQKEKALKGQVRLLSVTVDPGHDTPEVLAAYAKEHGADPALWSFLTGTPDQISSLVVNGFHLGLGSPAGEGQTLITHSDRVLLVDPQGRIRAMYHADELDPAKVLDDLRRL